MIERMISGLWCLLRDFPNDHCVVARNKKSVMVLYSFLNPNEQLFVHDFLDSLDPFISGDCF